MTTIKVDVGELPIKEQGEGYDIFSNTLERVKALINDNARKEIANTSAQGMILKLTFDDNEVFFSEKTLMIFIRVAMVSLNVESDRRKPIQKYIRITTPPSPFYR